MFGLVVMEVMTLPGHLSNINGSIPSCGTDQLEIFIPFCHFSISNGFVLFDFCKSSPCSIGYLEEGDWLLLDRFQNLKVLAYLQIIGKGRLISKCPFGVIKSTK